MDFFITGLPRSRTAWLANLLTWGRTFCYHEPLYSCTRVADLNLLADKAKAEGLLNVGGSDSGLPFFWRETRELFPNALWLVVRRPVKDVVISYTEYFTKHPFHGMGTLSTESVEELCINLDRELDALCRTLPDSQKLVVRFDDLGETNTVRYLWHFLTSEKFSRLRFEQLKNFRINVVSENYDLRKVCFSGDETKA